MSKELGINLDNSKQWFAEQASLLDPGDVMDHEMSFEQFKRRIGNYLLYRLYLQTSYTNSSARMFIKRIRKEYQA